MFVRIRVPAEFIKKESKIVFYARDVPFVTRPFKIVGCGRVFDDSPVCVVLTAFRRAESS
jgi:hypothetical protein